MNKEDFVYVKVTYSLSSRLPPSITHHKTQLQADNFMKICKKLGHDIVSCEIIDSKQVPMDFIL